MIGPPVEHLGVQVRAGVMRKSGEKVFQQLDLQVADMHHAHLLVINKRGAPTEIHSNHGKRFIHRLNEISRSVDTAPLAQSLRKQIA